jgi:phage terminase large subunit
MSVRTIDPLADYRPRAIFNNFHARYQRWAIEVVHRRGGKTVASLEDTISRIIQFQPPPNGGPGRFAYVAPFYKQAKEVAWDYAKRFSKGADKKVSEGDLSIVFFNDVKLTLYGADNPDSLRGLYFDGAVLDEFGDMRPSTWSEVILPTLIDREGWATFIGTPNGPNHFRDLYLAALLDPERWFVERHPVSETLLIPEEELAEMRKLMLPEEYEQEMECSFEASTRGAFYVAEMSDAEKEGRIHQLTPNPDQPMHFIFDLGFTDDTAIIGYQEATDGYPIIHAESDHYRPISHYIARLDHICQLHGVKRGKVWLPQDARAKSLQTGRSIVEQFVSGGIRPEIVPAHNIVDGIAAARLLFPQIHFNEPYTRSLALALKSYRRSYDEDKKVFSNKPVHDGSSHYADVFRYFSMIVRRIVEPEAVSSSRGNGKTTEGNNYAFSLDQLYKDRGQRRGGRRWG